MTLHLSDEQVAIQDTAQRFSKERLLPDYLKRETIGTLDRALMREMGELGLIGVDLPEQYGGLGASGTTAGIVSEAIAYGDINVSYVQLIASLMGQVLVHHASPEICQEWVPAMVKGEKIVALGLTEPRGGSDAANLVLSARRKGNGYVLNGEKTSISFAADADAAVVFARTGTPEQGARGVSAFMVDLNQKGVTRTKLDDIGTTIVGRGSLFFDDVFVPGRASAGRGRRRLRADHAGLRLLARADRAAVHRAGAGLARRGLGVHQGAAGLRRAAGPVPRRQLSRWPRPRPI